EIKLHVTDVHEPGSLSVQEDYYDLLLELWLDDIMTKYAECVSRYKLSVDIDLNCMPLLDEDLVVGSRAFYHSFIEKRLDDYIQEEV
ncbi:hypothetical protein ACJBXM_11135, partial [Streptococcus suis]